MLLETLWRFRKTLASHMFFKYDKMSQSTASTVKTKIVFLKYIFQFFINKVLEALTASTSRISWAKVLKMINLTGIFNTSCRGTTDNMLTFHAGGLGFNSRCWKCFFFLSFGPFVVVGFFPRKTYFHILTDLKYTGRLIAGFISTSYS